MPDQKDKKIMEIITNNMIPTLFVDNLAISKRSDGIYLLRFTTSLPEGLQEQVRMMVPQENMKNMLDVLCRHCDHYPTKQKT
jgi:hypothetical protein